MTIVLGIGATVRALGDLKVSAAANLDDCLLEGAEVGAQIAAITAPDGPKKGGNTDYLSSSIKAVLEGPGRAAYGTSEAHGWRNEAGFAGMTDSRGWTYSGPGPRPFIEPAREAAQQRAAECIVDRLLK